MSTRHAGAPSSDDYRLAPALAARLLGLGLAAVGVLVCLTTVVAGVARLPAAALLVIALLALLAIGWWGWFLTRRARVLSLGPVGYRVRMVRGVGTPAARWEDVESLIAAEIAGDRCIVLRLRHGASSRIPVAAVAADPEELMSQVRAHLEGRRSAAGGPRP